MNIGILGTGGIAAAHALGINSLEDTIARLYACCDIDQAKVEKFCQTYGGRPFSDLDLMLADPALDAVIVCLPHGLHARMGIKVMKAGKHVLVEKPMAPNVAECKKLIQGSKETGKKLQIGHEYFLYPTVQEAAKVIRSGELGKPLMVRAELSSYIYNKLGTWWMDFEQSKGGSAINMGVHLIDITSFILNKNPKRVRGFSRQLHPQAVKGIEDYFVMELDFGDGMFSDNHIYSFEKKIDVMRPAVTVFCEEGSLSVWSNELVIQKGSDALETRLKGDGSKAYLVFAEQIKLFKDFVEKGTTPRATGRFGMEAVACIEAAVNGDNNWKTIKEICGE